MALQILRNSSRILLFSAPPTKFRQEKVTNKKKRVYPKHQLLNMDLKNIKSALPITPIILLNPVGILSEGNLALICIVPLPHFASLYVLYYFFRGRM